MFLFYGFLANSPRFPTIVPPLWLNPNPNPRAGDKQLENRAT